MVIWVLVTIYVEQKSLLWLCRWELTENLRLVFSVLSTLVLLLWMWLYQWKTSRFLETLGNFLHWKHSLIYPIILEVTCELLPTVLMSFIELCWNGVLRKTCFSQADHVGETGWFPLIRQRNQPIYFYMSVVNHEFNLAKTYLLNFWEKTKCLGWTL